MPVRLLLFGCLVCYLPVAVAQDPPNAKTRRRMGLKPGEVTTPAALAERREETLKVGDPAPDFALRTRTGEQTIRLSQHQGKQPVVLVFGSLTCPPFRREVPDLERLSAQYGDRAQFYLVYLREAHPESLVTVKREGQDVLEKLGQTETWEQRAQHAELCTTTLKLTFPALVDNVDNQVRDTYAGWPSRLMVIGTDGKVAYDGGRGPRGFRPDALASWLKTELGEPRVEP